MYDDKVLTRFWRKVDKSDENGCWLWRASSGASGYGQFCLGGTMVGAHRVSFEIHNGSIPDGLHVLHRCDVPTCVSPMHLFLGTHRENIADRHAKGRTSKAHRNQGESHGLAKLGESQVSEIRRLYAHGDLTQREIAEMFGVTQSLVSHVVNGRLWRHV